MKAAHALAVLTALLASACSPFEDRVSATIGAAARAEHAQEIRIASITDFKWDTMLVFDAYAPRAYVCQALAVPAGDCASVVPFESVDDGIMSLAFVSDGKVVRYVRHGRRNGDFAPSPKGQAIPASKAVFKVVLSDPEPDGRRRVRLVLSEA
ncbi:MULTISPECIES: hypothetical protein [unclassified Rhizobacter]|uniref:hypothetical protein n=1 Tax=unclassified Rhizobacter TaxID=2640088 RepID=UPI0012F84D29|nr:MULTISPECIES: hypothetical protein [unclassified Rhizobacter]